MPDVFGLLIMAAVAGSWVMIAIGLLPDHEDLAEELDPGRPGRPPLPPPPRNPDWRRKPTRHEVGCGNTRSGQTRAREKR